RNSFSSAANEGAMISFVGPGGTGSLPRVPTAERGGDVAARCPYLDHVLERDDANAPSGGTAPFGAEGVLVRAEEVVKFHGRAVVKAAVRPGGTDENTCIREINAQRRAPGIDEFTLFVQWILSADQDDNVLRVFAHERS